MMMMMMMSKLKSSLISDLVHPSSLYAVTVTRYTGHPPDGGYLKSTSPTARPFSQRDNNSILEAYCSRVKTTKMADRSSISEPFLLQPFVCGTVFHRTSLLPPLHLLLRLLSLVLNHISSYFVIPLSDSSLICTVPAHCAQ